MSFLTSAEATGLGQPWYDESNVVAGMGGLLSMQELTSVKNYYEDPPMFPASVGLNGLGLPASDLVRGELESPRTLVDTTSVGNVRHKRNQAWHGRRRRRRGRREEQARYVRPGEGPCAAELAARKAASHTFRACAKKHFGHTKTQVQAGVAEPGTAAIVSASEGAVLAGLGGSPVPISDLARGEYERAVQMVSHPQAFGGLGAGAPVPRGDFVRGEIVSGGTLVDHAQAFGGLGQGLYHGQYGQDLFGNKPGPVRDASGRLSHAGKMSLLPQASGFTPPIQSGPVPSLPQAYRDGGPFALPVADLAPGELTHAAKMIALPQAFGGMGATLQVGPRVPGKRHGNYGRPVPISDLVPGEYERARQIAAHPQSFSLSGLGAGRAVPISDLAPGEYVTGKTLVDHAQGFGGLGAGSPVPISDLARGEYERASRMVSHPQAFGGLGDWIPFTPGEPEPTDGTQGTWLSPSQVPAWDRESAKTLVSQPQNFGGLGNNAVPRGDFVEGEIERASRMLKHKQAFGGMGDFLPFEANMPEPADGGQGTWLSPSQVPAWDRESAKTLVSHPQAFGGLGQPVPIPDLIHGEYFPASKITGHPQAFGGLGQPKAGELNLSPICDPQTGACIRYATPQEVQSAIGQKVGGKSALVKSQVKLPAFYSHPQLGPWGVDPRSAYQYWWAQQAAMQRAAVSSPLSIWGSPGFVAPTPPLPPSPIAQTAAFNPYNDGYPVAGSAVERF